MNVMSCQRSLFKTQRTDEELLLDEVFFPPSISLWARGELTMLYFMNGTLHRARGHFKVNSNANFYSFLGKQQPERKKETLNLK